MRLRHIDVALLRKLSAGRTSQERNWADRMLNFGDSICFWWDCGVDVNIFTLQYENMIDNANGFDEVEAEGEAIIDDLITVGIDSAFRYSYYTLIFKHDLLI